MKKKKILGYILILFGLGIPLFSLVGLNYTSSSTIKQYRDFKAWTMDLGPETLTIKKDKGQAYNSSLTGSNEIVDPWSSPAYEASYPMFDGLGEDAFAFMALPSINQYQNIYLGASQANLSRGFAHVDGTSLPIGGKGTRSVISGHRSTLIDVTLLHADKLKEGDRMFIDLGYQVLEYEMVSSELIYPYQWEKLSPEADVDMVTLLTCDPVFPPFEKRLLVNFIRVEEDQSLIAEENFNDKEAAEEPKEDTLVDRIVTSQGLIPEVKKQEAIMRILMISFLVLFIIVLSSFISYLVKGAREKKD